MGEKHEGEGLRWYHEHLLPQGTDGVETWEQSAAAFQKTF